MRLPALQRAAVLAAVLVAVAAIPAAAMAPGMTFDKDVYETNSDESVTMTLQLNDSETGTVTLGSEDAGYQMNVTVMDNTSDGTVEMTVYAQRLGISAPKNAVEVAGNDTLVSASNETLGDRIDAGEYQLSASVNGTETDVATLSIMEANTTTTTPATTSDPPETTTQPTDEGVDTTTTTADESGGDDGGDSGGSPGFGVGVALVALVAAALLAVREN
ncbi:PGF-CTERM sorting domain-containing protein [Haloarchaeobius sp. DFWS5]|uniref:DUF7827 domain-containing protein n=1 Tax=Haloarchaeobius sp. DFWS5 TaxID=3446114 RepID=UPI003EBFB5C6